MAYYLNSTKIFGFPITRRTYESANAKQLTESNLTTLVNNIVDADSFVITKELPSTEDENSFNFEFNIHGYYFKINYCSLLKLFNYENNTPSAGTSIYAGISLAKQYQPEDKPEEQQIPVPKSFWEVAGQDVDSEYKGVEFVLNPDSEALNVFDYTIKLIEVSNVGGSNTWIIPETSLIKYNISSIELPTIIDGGFVEIESSTEQSSDTQISGTTGISTSEPTITPIGGDDINPYVPAE